MPIICRRGGYYPPATRMSVRTKHMQTPSVTMLHYNTVPPPPMEEATTDESFVVNRRAGWSRLPARSVLLPAAEVSTGNPHPHPAAGNALVRSGQNRVLRRRGGYYPPAARTSARTYKRVRAQPSLNSSLLIEKSTLAGGFSVI